MTASYRIGLAGTIAALAFAAPALATDKTPPTACIQVVGVVCEEPTKAPPVEQPAPAPIVPEAVPVAHPDVPLEAIGPGVTVIPPGVNPDIDYATKHLPPPDKVTPLPRIKTRATCRVIPRGAGRAWFTGRLGFRCPLPDRLRSRVPVFVAVTG